MSFPVTIHLGPLALNAHVVFETLAYFIGFRIYSWERKNAGDIVGPSTRWTIILSAAIGGAIGSKFLHHLSSPERLAAHWQDPLFIMGGKTIVGGLLGGFLCVEVVKKYYGIKKSTGDLFAIPLCIAIAVGRIGCFLSGTMDDTIGAHTQLPIGIDFGDGLRHPTPLYEIFFLITLALAIYKRKNRPYLEGQLFSLFMFSYLTFRFFCDFLKDYEILFGLRGIQWACLFGLIHYGLKLRVCAARLNGVHP